jgi:hypothetical protein
MGRPKLWGCDQVVTRGLLEGRPSWGRVLAWRDHEDVPRGLRGVTAARAIGPDAVVVGP